MQNLLWNKREKIHVSLSIFPAKITKTFLVLLTMFQFEMSRCPSVVHPISSILQSFFPSPWYINPVFVWLKLSFPQECPRSYFFYYYCATSKSVSSAEYAKPLERSSLVYCDITAVPIADNAAASAPRCTAS